MVSEMCRWTQSGHLIVSWCQKCADEPSPDIISYHGVRMCMIESTSAWQICWWQTGTLFHQELIPRLRQGFHCVHSGFKGLAISSVRGIVTFNNCRSYCLDSSWTLTFLTCPVLHSFLIKGGNTWKYMAIHEIVVNLDNLLSFSWVILVWVRYPSQGYPSDANSHKETKEVWTLQPKPSQLEEQCRLGATVQPYPVIT